MTDKEIKCEKCGGAMEKGSVVDKSYMEVIKSQWTSSSNRFGVVGAFKHDPNKKEIVAFRCVLCGYLESYAK